MQSENVRKGTIEQLSTLTQMIVAGKMDHEELQDFIDKHKRMPSLKMMRQETNTAFGSPEELRMGLSEVIPQEDTDKLMKFLRPFLKWDLEAMLKRKRRPSDEFVRTQAYKAIFWRNIGGCSHCSNTSYCWITNPSSNSWSGVEPMGHSLRLMCHSLENPRLVEDLRQVILPYLQALYAKGELKRHRKIVRGLAETLCAICILRFFKEDEKVTRMMPLLDLWKAGYFPIGFDDVGMLCMFTVS